MELDITDLLPEKHILWKPVLQSKKRVFEQVALLFENTDGLPRDKIFRMLIERERLGSTAVGDGGAIPHGRLHGIKTPLCALVHLDKPILYGDTDESNGIVRTLFFLITPNHNEKDHHKVHLILLAAFAEMLSNKEFVSALDLCPNASAVHNKIKEWVKNRPLLNVEDTPPVGV